MKANQSFMAGSSFHAGSLGSFRKAAEITPAEFSNPAGAIALAIEAEASFTMKTGCHLSDEDKTVQIAKTFLDALEERASELVVLPEHHDLAMRIIGLDVVGVDAPLRPERWLPAHGPGKRLGLAQLLVAGGDEELRDLLLVQVPARGEIAGRPERPEHQVHVVLLDQTASQIERRHGIGIVVARDEADLAAVDATAIVDHVEISGFRLADRAEFRERSRIGHDIADADFIVGGGLL